MSLSHETFSNMQQNRPENTGAIKLFSDKQPNCQTDIY